MRGILQREPRQPQTFWGALASSVLIVLLLSAGSAAAQPIDDPNALSDEEMRARIARALQAARLDARALIDEMIADTLDGAAPPVVGEPFSWLLGTLMLPTVLAALPELPEPLQYRFVAADLVVIDTRTNIVVGIVYDALPGGAGAGRRGTHRKAIREYRFPASAIGDDWRMPC